MPSDLAFLVATLTRRGLLKPGSPRRVAAQLGALRNWGFSLAGELRQAAARDPDRIALVDEERGEVSYRELLDRAERLARSLRARYGVTEGDRIGVLCRNHSGLVETAVAGGLLGADIVLGNTGLSGAQLAAVAQEQRFRLLVHDDEFLDRVVGLPAEVHRIDEREYPELMAGAPHGELHPPERDGRTIVLTSGTTGTPKGARRPTPNGLGPLVAIIDRIPLHHGVRMMIAAPLFHTWGYAALQMAFALRGTVVLHRRFEPVAAVAALRRHSCTALFAVPVMLQRLLEVPPAATPPLEVVAVSGSALPGGLAPRFMDRYGDVLYNLYGSTEVSWAAIATPAELRRAPTTAGRPPHGTRLAIVDAAGEPVPAGQVGRILVGNELLFEGYTAGGPEQQGRVAGPARVRLLDTGDLGHLDADGLLHVDGRADDMIVSGGENVHPAEVENLLAELPQVREVAVIGVPDRTYGQRLVAYLVLRPGETIDPDAVREYVRRYRARFSVPRDVNFVPALPRNATGKVMTRELRRYHRA
ncbi:AMP-binding protein [Micromonospora sp. WMMD1102]|uniref:AMP-binding protein n=1 Tax=Micromonospora sp. WMMD1102 TaxID=3016105 RepID=UPI0024157DA7|nr:AMP-binding protein [Micromonospora sp. WMMD1102]MDG4790754.1 AMP-binding protein [Micromonospora sp. WMMD1102]MDG4792226.1 AMP-binding protein [Micromonospora sp. WMMD1102]